MNAPIARWDAFEIRRDAVVELPNGYVRAPAFFQRAGLQSYPDGDEYRPTEEVFAASSLRSNATAPIALLHPPQNYSGNFGPGAHPIRGCTGENMRPHSDGIHVVGDLVMWDSELIGLAMSREVIELSNGYSINPDPTPGIVPDGLPGAGKPYGVIHRDIIVDHVAFVPEGNAGTARVLLDAVQPVHAATRRALADIAAMRADARPYYHDLGAWQTRRARATKPRKTAMDKAKLAKLARAILDAKISIEGEDTDPKMLAAFEGLLAALPAPAEPEPAPAEGAPAEPMPEGEPVADEEPDDQLAAAGPPPSPAPTVAKADAAAVHERAKVIAFGIDALGYEWADRLDASASTGAIKLEILRRVDADKAERLDRLDASSRPGALAFAFAEARDIHRERKDWAERTIEALNASRQAREDGGESEIDGPITRMSKAVGRK